MHIKSSKMNESKNLLYIRKHVKYGPFYIPGRSLELSYFRKGKEEEEKQFQKEFESDSGFAGRERPSWDENGHPGTEADAERWRTKSVPRALI